MQEIAQALDDLNVSPSGDLVTTNTTQTITASKTFSNTIDFTVAPDFNNVRLTNVATPTALNDATNKDYVDSNFIPNNTTN